MPKVQEWKELINKARELYNSMTLQEQEECDFWLDNEYIAINGNDGTIENVVSMNAN